MRFWCMSKCQFLYEPLFSFCIGSSGPRAGRHWKDRGHLGAGRNASASPGLGGPCFGILVRRTIAAGSLKTTAAPTPLFGHTELQTRVQRTTDHTHIPGADLWGGLSSPRTTNLFNENNRIQSCLINRHLRSPQKSSTMRVVHNNETKMHIFSQFVPENGVEIAGYPH